MKYYTCVETAKLLRNALKEAFPAFKFDSIRSRGGSIIDVQWTDGPAEEAVHAITCQFAGASFDGMQDLKTQHTSEYHGETIQFGADFIFPRRIYSSATFTDAATAICNDYGIPVPAFGYSETIGAHIIDNVYIETVQQYLDAFIGRRIREISFYTVPAASTPTAEAKTREQSPAAITTPAPEVAEIPPSPLEPKSPVPFGPFTQRDADATNRFSHYTTTADKLNAEYAETMTEYRQTVRAKLERWGIAETPDNIQDALDRLGSAYVHSLRENNRATGIAPGAYMVGPSNYKGNHSRADAIRRSSYEQLETAKKRLDSALRSHAPNGPISSDDQNAGDKLRAKIAKLETVQDTMKQANAIVRKKKLTDAEKLAQLIAAGMQEDAARQCLEPDYMGRLGFPSYALKNNLSEITRIKSRLQTLEQNRGAETREIPFSGGTIKDNIEANRVQIFFDSRPGAGMIANLKRRGFKWAPSIGAWQRMRSGVHVLGMAQELVAE